MSRALVLGLPKFGRFAVGEGAGAEGSAATFCCGRGVGSGEFWTTGGG